MRSCTRRNCFPSLFKLNWIFAEDFQFAEEEMRKLFAYYIAIAFKCHVNLSRKFIFIGREIHQKRTIEALPGLVFRFLSNKKEYNRADLFLLNMNQTELHFIHNQKEKCQHNRIPSYLQGNKKTSSVRALEYQVYSRPRGLLFSASRGPNTPETPRASWYYIVSRGLSMRPHFAASLSVNGRNSKNLQ